MSHPSNISQKSDTYPSRMGIIVPPPASTIVRKLSFLVVNRIGRKFLKTRLSDADDCTFFRQRYAAFAIWASLDFRTGKFIAFGLPHSNSSSYYIIVNEIFQKIRFFTKKFPLRKIIRYLHPRNDRRCSSFQYIQKSIAIFHSKCSSMFFRCY